MLHAFPKLNARGAGFLLLVLAALFLLPSIAAASSSGGGLPYEGDLEQVRNSFTGTWAYTVAIAGILGAGATLIWGQELNGFLRSVIYIVCVLSMLVGVNAWLQGRGAEIALQTTQPTITRLS